MRLLSWWDLSSGVTVGPNVVGRADDQVVRSVRDGRWLAGGSQQSCGFEVVGWAWVGGGPGCSVGSVWNSGWEEVGGAWA